MLPLPVAGQVVVALALPGTDALLLSSHPLFLCTFRQGMATLSKLPLGAVTVRVMYNPMTRDSVVVGDRWGKNVTDCEAQLIGRAISTNRVLQGSPGLPASPAIMVARGRRLNMADKGGPSMALQAEVQISMEGSGVVDVVNACADQPKEARFLSALQSSLLHGPTLATALGPAVQAACTAQGMGACPAPADVIVMWALTHQPCTVPSPSSMDSTTLLYIYIGSGVGGALLLACGCVVVYRSRVRRGGAKAGEGSKADTGVGGINPMLNARGSGPRPHTHMRTVLRPTTAGAGGITHPPGHGHAHGIGTGHGHGTGTGYGHGQGTGHKAGPGTPRGGWTSKRRNTIPDIAFTNASPHVLRHLASRKMLFTPSPVRQDAGGGHAVQGRGGSWGPISGVQWQGQEQQWERAKALR